MKIGDKVRADPHHWLRANCSGTVVDVNYHREEGCSHSIYVKFDDAQVGRGINGDELWMNPRELVLEGAAKRKGN